MTNDEFGRKLKDTLSSTQIKVGLLADWFEKILVLLDSLAEQQSSIGHPGQKGKSREDALRQQLEPTFPKSLYLSKGFAVNRLLAVSREQDLIILNRETAMSLIPDQPYFPIHSCLASIEVKSRLAKTEVRESVLNCISLKKLLGDHPHQSVDEERMGQYCYAIFAYTSRKSLENTADDINEALTGVPHYLRPNVIYILGKGMLIPSESHAISLTLDQMFCDAEFRPVPKMGAPPSIPANEAYAFLWYITNIIDHCLRERRLRPPLVVREYWETTLMLQERLVNRDLRSRSAE